MFEIHQVGHAAELPRAGWDHLALPSDIFLSCRWLDVVEATAGVDMRYFWIEKGGKVEAGLATALAVEQVPWALGRPDFVLRNSVRDERLGASDFLAQIGADPTTALMPALVAGGRHVGSNKLMLGEGAGPAEVIALLEAAESHARRGNAKCVTFLYMDEQDYEVSAELSRRGYVAFDTGEYSVLDVPVSGFDGYLATLPSKRRISVKAERRRIREQDVSVVKESLSDANLIRLAELEAELLRKYDIAIAHHVLVALLEQVRECFPDDAFALVLRAGGVIRGFVLVLRRGDQWLARQTGFDYKFQREAKLPLYFELVYYRLLEEAAAAGAARIHYGLGSAVAKKSRGCTASTQRCHTLLLENQT